MIAGCMNQATRILEKYDKVLFGPPPEAQIEEVHATIRELLVSQECEDFCREIGSTTPEAVARLDLFLKKIIEAVPPIIPVALRNKALDGAYLRTALHFLGAAELMFARYETDVRRQSNPAGVVGLCTAMHTNFEQCAVLNKELSAQDIFAREMTTQYQTSLGLGFGFPYDITRKSGRKSTYKRGKSYSRSSLLRGRGLNREQHGVLAEPSGTAGDRNSTQQAARRARGVCHGFLSGTCWRGANCKFLHNAQ